MNKISLAKKLFLLFSVVFFASCDKEFNTIGSDIVGDDYFEFEKEVYDGVVAYDSITGPVQSNNLKLNKSINSLGTYNDPAFGTTTSHFVTQVELPFANVTINTHPEVDSVWVYVPYFIDSQTGTDDDGIRQFLLDSVYGGTKKFRLNVYENGYYLGNFNPDNENGTQRHYSDEKIKIETYKRGATSAADGTSIPNGLRLNNSGITAENDQFFFNPVERIIYKTNGQGEYVDAAGEVLDNPDDLSTRVVKERFVPGIWLNLHKDFFKKKILEASASNLTNNNVFKEYFRGLYFQVESLGAAEGALAMLDFSKGYIKIAYNMDNVASSATPTATRLRRTLTLPLTGNTINFFESNHTIPGAGHPHEDTRLYLQGGNGSLAYINVFGDADADADGIPDQLELYRDKGWMINEASLTFYIDDNTVDGMGRDGQVEPNRIYLFDAKNKKPIVDYYADGSTNSAKPKYNKRGFGGIIEKDANGKGIKYKIRLTEYLKSCINKDSTNFKLGLVVTEDINTTSNAYLKPPSGENPKKVVPLSSVLSPLGTILHSPTSENPDKRLKLEIYYTKPD